MPRKTTLAFACVGTGLLALSAQPQSGPKSTTSQAGPLPTPQIVIAGHKVPLDGTDTHQTYVWARTCSDQATAGCGEVSPNGSYKAPEVAPAHGANTVTITATPRNSPGPKRIWIVTIKNPTPEIEQVDVEKDRGADGMVSLQILGRGLLSTSTAMLDFTTLDCDPPLNPTALTCRGIISTNHASLTLKVANPDPVDGAGQAIFKVPIEAKPSQPSSPSPPNQSVVPGQSLSTLNLKPPANLLRFRALWLGLFGFSAVAIVVFAILTWRLRIANSVQSLDVSSLQFPISSLSQQAILARARYDDLARRLRAQTAPLAYAPVPTATTAQPVQKWQPPVPVSEAEVRQPSSPYPASVVAGSPPSVRQQSARNDLIEAYRQARSTSAGRDQFENIYPYVRISCINHEEWRIDKTIVLVFQKEDWGWYIMVSRGSVNHVLPWFNQDLAGERQSFEGAFQYPEREAAGLRLATAATVTARGEKWILSNPGVVESDG